ncbi:MULTISPECIES: N-acetyl-gamma-glutamyl-phosphate reductase [unclassified Paraflavitalea]|uniref:N-acetyl-gamma-glutamyl-phosphate reductase n=1 Tax=unclassified Paraflavitalea TaxID=2798305 RepID=UPI003D34B866
MSIKVGIIGGAGYTGGELLRILIHHPEVSLTHIHSRSTAGKPISTVHSDLEGDTDLIFTDDTNFVSNGSIDVLVLCLGHGESRKFLQEHTVAANTKIIDLANDFRLKPQSTHNDIQFVYGLPELNKEAIKSARAVANPGCFATTLQLGLLPLAKAGLLSAVYTTGITGSTGAGQSLSATSHFSWRANNIQAYKTLTHQHLGEINQSIQQLNGNQPVSVNFVPWRGDFTRGIFISSQLSCDASLAELETLYREFYLNHPFTHLINTSLHLKQVVNTNKCLIQLEKIENQLVVHSATDNLLKGASGQAVQNLNLMFGLDEGMGLRLKGSGF